MMRLEKQIDNLSAAFNWVAGVSILVMMLLTCADVVLPVGCNMVGRKNKTFIPYP